MFYRITKNTSALVIADLITKILAFCYQVLVPAFLLPAGWGLLALALAFASIVENFLDLGLNTLTVRDVARDQSLTSKYAINICVIKFLAGLITIPFMVFLSILFNYSPMEFLILMIIAISNIFYCMAFAFFSIFQAHEKMEYQSLGILISNIIIYGSSILFVFLHFTLIWFAIIYLFSFIIMFLFAVFVMRKKIVKVKFKLDMAYWRDLLKKGFPFFVGRLSISLYSYVGYVILSIFKGANSVGEYDVAHRLIFIVITMMSYFYTAMLPAMIKLKIDKELENFEWIVSFFLKYLSIVGILSGFVITVLAPDIILFLYHGTYSNSIVLLQILAWQIVFYNITSLFGNVLYIFNRQRRWMIVMVLTCIINFLLNFVMFYYFNSAGIALTNLITDAFAAFVLFLSSRDTHQSPLKGLVFKLAITALIPIFFIYIPSVSTTVRLLAGSMIYLLALFVARLIRMNEVKLIYAKIRKDVFHKIGKNIV